jgi:hypothetical protein
MSAVARRPVARSPGEERSLPMNDDRGWNLMWEFPFTGMYFGAANGYSGS